MRRRRRVPFDSAVVWRATSGGARLEGVMKIRAVTFNA
jgi:hypothetical protein